MILNEFAVRNRTSVFVAVAFAAVAGLVSYAAMPRESEPDVKIPYVFVSTEYRGVSPKDIETAVTIQIEKKLKGLKNVKKIKSSSSEGRSEIVVEFVTGTNIDDALQWVKDKVDIAKRELPTDLEDDPSVFEINLSEMPILTVALSGDLGQRQLKKVAEALEDEIEAIPGVLEVDLVGGREREIRVEVDPDRLAAYGIPFSVLYSVVRSENQNVSGGTVAMGDGRYQIRVPGEFTEVEEFQQLVVTTVDGVPVYLRDIATVADGHKDVTSLSRFDTRASVNLYVKKRAGENVIRIVDRVKALLREAAPRLPSGVQVTTLMDRSKEIRMMVADLENNIYTGFLLIVFVLMFAMGLRNAFLTSIAIPITMLLSFIVLHFMGISLNMITLFSLILAVGMLVDNAVVVVENIYRFTSQGVPRMQAAVRATSEVAWPIIGSTATTVVAFLPLLWWPGIMGDFMHYLPVTLIVTLSCSLFVGMVVNPAFCSVFIKAPSTVGRALSAEEIEAAGERPVEQVGRIVRIYEAVLRASLRARLSVVASAGLVLALAFLFWLHRTGIERPIEFFPSIDPENCFVNIDPPEGTDLEEIDRIAREIERRLVSFDDIPAEFRRDGGRPVEPDAARMARFQRFRREQGIDGEPPVSDLIGIRHLYTRLDLKGQAKMFAQESLPNHIGIQFYDYEGRPEPTSATMERIKARLEGIPGATLRMAKGHQGPPSGKPINIEVSGDDFATLGAIASRVRAEVEKIPHLKEIEDDFTRGAPTIELAVDRKRAALYGLTTAMIGTTIKTAINGWNVSTYREGNDDYDIVVRVDDSYRKDLELLKKLFLPAPNGTLVPLSDLVEVRYVGGLGAISRIDHRRVVTVKADVDEKKLPGATARQIAEKMIGGAELPPGYRITFTGENEMQEESEGFLGRAFMAAIMLVLMVLVLQFDSVANTLVILTAVVLAFGGVFLGLGIANIPFGVIMTGIGVISLAGVVVNNSIVLVDYIGQLRARGFDLTEAVVAAGKTRLRPVFLTMITTNLGLVPMISGISYDFTKWRLVTDSASVQWWYSLATVVFYGLLLATLLTLVVVPVIYHLIERMKMRAAALLLPAGGESPSAAA